MTKYGVNEYNLNTIRKLSTKKDKYDIFDQSYYDKNWIFAAEWNTHRDLFLSARSLVNTIDHRSLVID